MWMVTKSLSLQASVSHSAAARSTEAQDVLRDAEIAMYRAKHNGKARCEVFDNAMHASAVKRLQLETDLRKAVDLGEFLVYYQPIVSLDNEQIVGFEALTRWQRPQGMVMPNDFIPLADETGIILSINRAIAARSLSSAALLAAAFPFRPTSLPQRQHQPQTIRTDRSCLLRLANFFSRAALILGALIWRSPKPLPWPMPKSRHACSRS